MRFSSLLALGVALVTAVSTLPLPARAAKVVHVVTTTTDLAAIAQAVGGDKVEATPLAKGYADIHFFEPRPSDVVKIRKADVFGKMGLELDLWAQPLVDASRNSHLIQVDCSEGVPVLEKPTGAVNPSMGDVHPYGNPHYQLDPQNGKVIAENFVEAFKRADPADAAYFEERKNAFDSQLDQKLKEWQAKMAKARGAKVIDYHRELTYFANRFGLKVVGYVEPKPGVPPTPSHTQDLIQLVRNQKVKAIVMEQWYNQSTPQLIQRETGMPYVVIPTSVGGEPGVDTYFELFDRIIAKLAPVLS